MLTTDVIGIWSDYPSNLQLIISLGIIFFIFLFEIALLFADVVLESKIQTFSVSIGYFLAVFIATLAIAMLAVGAYLVLISLSPPDNKAKNGPLIVFITLSAFAKGMQVWLQNNMDRYNVKLNLEDATGTYVLSFEPDKQ